MTVDPGTVLLGTVALEPNRWGSRGHPDRPNILVSEYVSEIDRAGFDGVELWERHITEASPHEVTTLMEGVSPITILNSYVSFDEPDSASRDSVASWVEMTRSGGVKFNVGNDPLLWSVYADRISAWLATIPADVTVFCECHAGISIAEVPATAAAIFEAAGPADRVQAIVHTDEDAHLIRMRFDAYGDRISHVHVNYLGLSPGRAPKLSEVRNDLELKVALLRSLGFCGSWTIEFVHGLLSEFDQPNLLLSQATEDLAILRGVLEGAS